MEEKHYCPYVNCRRVLQSSRNLTRHIYIAHSDPDKYKCKICGKLLTSKQNFREHQYIHSGEKPYPCDQCGKSFRQGSQLSAHKRIHRAVAESRRDEMTIPCLTIMMNNFGTEKLWKDILKPDLIGTKRAFPNDPITLPVLYKQFKAGDEEKDFKKLPLPPFSCRQ